MTDLKATFWDFGGVILSSPFEAFARYEREHGLPPDFIRTVNATDPDTNAWACLERSEIGFEEFGDRFAVESAALGHRVDGREVLPLLAGEVRPRMVEALRRCRDAGYVTACLTNNFVSGDRATDPGRHGGVLDLFNHVVESSKVGVRKPDPRFYEIACELAGVTPEQVVFLDDLGVNLKPARAIGMRTVKVVDPDDALAELGRHVGLDLLA